MGGPSAETEDSAAAAVTWDLSCPDWKDRLRSGRSLVPHLPIDLEAGNRAVAVFNKLRLADVEGTPELGDAAGEWFRDIVRALFGSVDPETRARAIRELFLLVPKKNSKTTYGALMMLTALLLNQRPNAPFIMTAPVQDVADLAFSAAKGAIDLDPVLAKKLHVREHLKTIVHRESKAELKIMTFDPSVLTGQKCAGVLIDELHVVAKMSKAASAILQLRGGMLPFPEAFMAFITTQSESAPSGVFRAELKKARAIRDGKQAGSMLPVLYEFPPELQTDKRGAWKDSANWTMVTPNVGRSISIARLVEDMRTAEDTSEAELRAWASQHLNIEVGLALMGDGWDGAAFWEACTEEGLDLEALLERSEVVTVGIDGGGLKDLLSLHVLGREAGTGRWLAWQRSWVHEIALDRQKQIAERLRDFERDGDLVIVGKIGDDITELADVVEQVDASGLLPEKNAIGLDPSGVGDIVEELLARGIDREKIVGVSQGWKLVGAIKTAERRLAEGALAHGGRPIMAWCVGNAQVEPRANAMLITKQASGAGKIDPLMALLDAVTLMSMNPEAQGGSFWENRAA